jgi:demethylspheroidene O-methyltransferase
MPWVDHWTALRDRLASSARFRAWAASNLVTRSIARRHARELFDLCSGFVYSQVLLACVQLRLFELLRARSCTIPEIAERLSLSTEAAERLLRAASALQLSEERPGERYGLGRLGAAMVDNPSLVAMIEHHAILYADLRNPVALLRGEVRDTALARYWPYAGTDSPRTLGVDETTPYTTLMSASQAMVRAEVVDAYPFDRHRCLLDLGGGDGTFVAALAAGIPKLRFLLFDLPPVARLATARFAANGLAHRATAIGGDFFTDPLPNGADIICLVRVLHDHDNDSALRILRSVRLALPAGGIVLIAEPMSRTAGAEPVGDAYFGFYFMAMGRGRARSRQEFVGMLKAAGFVNARSVRTHIPLITSMIIAQA